MIPYDCTNREHRSSILHMYRPEPWVSFTPRTRRTVVHTLIGRQHRCRDEQSHHPGSSQRVSPSVPDCKSPNSRSTEPERYRKSHKTRKTKKDQQYTHEYAQETHNMGDLTKAVTTIRWYSINIRIEPPWVMGDIPPRSDHDNAKYNEETSVGIVAHF